MSFDVARNSTMQRKSGMNRGGGEEIITIGKLMYNESTTHVNVTELSASTCTCKSLAMFVFLSVTVNSINMQCVLS